MGLSFFSNQYSLACAYSVARVGGLGGVNIVCASWQHFHVCRLLCVDLLRVTERVSLVYPAAPSWHMWRCSIEMLRSGRFVFGVSYGRP